MRTFIKCYLALEKSSGRESKGGKHPGRDNYEKSSLSFYLGIYYVRRFLKPSLGCKGGSKR